MKKKFMFYLLVIISLTSFSIAFLVSAFSERTIADILDNNKNDVINQIKQRLLLFDKYLFVFESGMREIAQSAVLNISREFKDSEATKKITPADIKSLALKNGVSEIYFLNREGTVYNTSFRPDMGLNIVKSNTDIAEFIKSMFGKTEVSVQRIGISMKTGSVNMYAYYNPPGADYLIEISIWLNDYVDAKCSKGFYDKIRAELFNNLKKENSYLRSVDMFSITDVSKWSFINEGKAFKGDDALIKRIFDEKEIKTKNDGVVTFYKTISFDTKEFPWSDRRVIIEIIYDFSPLDDFRTKAFYYSLLISFAIVMISFLLSSRVLNNYIISRIININETLKKISAGDYSARISDEKNDEISNISNEINHMAEKIGNRVQSLEELLPICPSCKKVRDDKGYWNQLEQYFHEHSGIKFTHGTCPECFKTLYPDLYAKKAGMDAAVKK